MSAARRQYLGFECGFGPIRLYVVCSEQGPAHISFDQTRHDAALVRLASKTGTSVPTVENHPFKQVLLDFFTGRIKTFPTYEISPFVLEASPFARRVWARLSEIPYGTTRTYGEIAKELGGTGYARALGRACGANPLTLLVPCHRVVGAGGQLGGFSGGSAVKQALLALERGEIAEALSARQTPTARARSKSNRG